jgi:uncharacterized MAPEG superfamily protein
VLAGAYAFLSLQFIATMFFQVFRRVAHETPINREDPGFKSDRPLLNTTNTLHYASKDKEDHPVLRAQRVLNNNLESWVPFILASLSFAASMYATKKSSLISLASTCVVAFPILRFFHTLFYLSHVQPFRTISFVISTVCTVALALTSAINLIH